MLASIETASNLSYANLIEQKQVEQQQNKNKQDELIRTESKHANYLVFNNRFEQELEEVRRYNQILNARFRT